MREHNILKFINILLILTFIPMLSGCREDSEKKASEISSQAGICLSNGNYQKAKELFIQASDLRPSCAEYHIGVAMASLKINDSETARTRYNKALDIMEGQSRNDPNRIDDYIMVLVCLGRKEDAGEALNKAKERFKSNRAVISLSDNFNTLAESWAEYKINR